MTRPSYNSLKLNTDIGRSAILYKESQDMGMGAPGGMPPDVGQSPVTGNPDEMQAPESANQRQFEDDFGSLAYQFVQDRAPALMPYMLGFEVVDRNEDGSKAVGIFGYKVDDDYYYVPAFFLNNQIRGVDMILNKKTNQFIPLIEEWIDYIINRHSVRIGGPGDERVRETMRHPDLSFVRRPQELGKTAEESSPWTFQEAWGKIKEATARLASDPEASEMITGVLVSVKGGSNEKKAESTLIKDFMKTAGGPECMLSFFKTMHDVGFANAALSLYKDAEAFWTDDLVNAKVHVDRMSKAAAARPKVRVTNSTAGMPKAAEDDGADVNKDPKGDAPKADVGLEDTPLTIEENARQIIEHDFTIEDTRPEEEVSEVTEDKVLVDLEHRFQPPDRPGKYDFVMSDGQIREGIMLNTVLSSTCNAGNTMVCFDDDDAGGIVLAEASPVSMLASDVGSRDPSDDDSLKSLFEKAVTIGNVEADPVEDTAKSYLFINNKGCAVGPYQVKYVVSDGGHDRLLVRTPWDSSVVTTRDKSLEPQYGYMDWDMSDRYHDFDGTSNGKTGRGNCDCACCEAPCSDAESISIGSPGGEPKSTSSGIILPSDWKALEVKVVKRYPRYNSEDSAAERMEKERTQSEKYEKIHAKYTFGTPSDILNDMQERGIERIKLAFDGTEYSMKVGGFPKSVGPMNYKQACVELVTKFGLRPRRAFSIVKKASEAGNTRFMVRLPLAVNRGYSAALEKKSQMIDNLSTVNMPYPAEQVPGVDPYSGVPFYTTPYIDIVQGTTTNYPGLPPEGGMTHGINFGGEMERGMGGSGDIAGDEHGADFEGALPIDQEAQRLAQEAAEAGQRHVFDQAAIGGLAKVYDTANVVDSYIPDFMDTIDRLGRILFLFYWKHEDFNSRYGSDDVVQMEDKLRSVFKQLGSLTLDLKNKAVHEE